MEISFLFYPLIFTVKVRKNEEVYKKKRSDFRSLRIIVKPRLTPNENLGFLSLISIILCIGFEKNINNPLMR